MAPLYKNCRPSLSNVPGVGKPWRPGEVRTVSAELAKVMADITGFRAATEAELEDWQLMLAREKLAAEDAVKAITDAVKAEPKSKAKAKSKATKKEKK